MGQEITDNPHDVKVARFARRTIKIGFVGGQEKTIEYDERQDSTEIKTQYRQYVEAERPGPNPDADLEDLARERNVFTVTDRNDVSYREFQGMEEKFLISWDDGQSVHIVEADEVDKIMDVAASIRGGQAPPEPSQEQQSPMDQQPARVKAEQAAQEMAASEEEDREDTEEPDTDIQEEPEEPADTEVEEEEYDTDIPEPVATDQ